MSEFSFVGKPTPVIDGPAKVTGNLKYTGDLKLAGMLHARFVLSAFAHANITDVDASAALAIPGVQQVLTADDLPDVTPSSRARLMLARGRVIFVGQPIAIVLADTAAGRPDSGIAPVRGARTSCTVTHLLLRKRLSIRLRSLSAFPVMPWRSLRFPPSFRLRPLRMRLRSNARCRCRCWKEPDR